MTDRRFILVSPGGLEAESADEPETDELRILGTGSVLADPGPWCGWGGPLDYAADQGADDGRSLAFTTRPLDEPLEIVGFPSVAIRVSSDTPQALVVARLCDVWPDGASTLITRGLRNLSHRDSDEEPMPLVPGETYDVAVGLNSISYVVPAGHRLRVALSPTYWPIAWPSPEAATLTLVTGGRSTLTLPVRRRDVTDPPPPEHFSHPEAAPPPPHVMHRGNGEERRWWRDARRGVTRVVAETDHFPHVRYLDSGFEYSEWGRDIYEITDGDPLSAIATSERRISVSRGDWTTRVETLSTMSSTRDEFQLTDVVDAFEGTTRIFAKTWSRSIPRDGV